MIQSHFPSKCQIQFRNGFIFHCDRENGILAFILIKENQIPSFILREKIKFLLTETRTDID